MKVYSYQFLTAILYPPKGIYFTLRWYYTHPRGHAGEEVGVGEQGDVDVPPGEHGGPHQEYVQHGDAWGNLRNIYQGCLHNHIKKIIKCKKNAIYFIPFFLKKDWMILKTLIYSQNCV